MYTKVRGMYMRRIFSGNVSHRDGRMSLSETSFHPRYPDVPVGQLATSLFTAGHPLEIRNGFTTNTNAIITDSR